MELISCEINLMFYHPTFRISDTELYVSVVTLSPQDKAKLLEQLKSGFKRKINWNKYKSKMIRRAENRYSDFFN